MPYELGFALIGRKLISRAYQPSARSALEAIDMLKAYGEQIRYIASPDGREINVIELSHIAEIERMEAGSSANK